MWSSIGRVTLNPTRQWWTLYREQVRDYLPQQAERRSAGVRDERPS